MSTPQLWRAFDIGQTLVSTFFTVPPVVWDTKDHRVKWVMGKKQYFWICTNILNFGIGSMVFLYDLVFLFKAPPSHKALHDEITSSKHTITTRAILSLVYGGGIAFCVGVFLWGPAILDILNAVFRLEQLFRQEMRKPGKQFKWLGRVVVEALKWVQFPPLLVTSASIWRGQDPYYTLFYSLIPAHWQTTRIRWAVGAIRFLLLLSVAAEITRVLVIGGVILPTLGVVGMNVFYLFQGFYEGLSYEQILAAEGYVKHYKEIQLTMSALNKAGSFITVIILVVTQSILLSLAFIIIKLAPHSAVDVLMVSTIILIVVFIFAWLSLEGGATPYNLSKATLALWRKGAADAKSRRKYMLKRIQSLRVFPVYAGYDEYGFFDIDTETQIEFFKTGLERLIDILVAVHV